MIFHLAAVVSGEAEANLELGYRVNLDGTRLLLDAIRAANAADGYRPKLVFTSSLAVFGPPFNTAQLPTSRMAPFQVKSNSPLLARGTARDE